MRQRDLEIALQRLEGFPSPKAELEQYRTPATIASDLLFLALGRGDIEGKAVLDIGCGSGILGIGAALLGAERVIGVDIDERAMSIVAENSRMAGVDVLFINQEVGQVDMKVDTVVMNPPFGAQRRRADRPFLEAAARCADTIYSLHMSSTEEFVRTFSASLGYGSEVLKRYKFEIPYMFEFHRRPKKNVDVSLFRIQMIR